MQRYRDYAPTCFDARGLNGDDAGISDYGILISQDRDSEALDLSNFRVALDVLGGESDDVQIHRFRHWACGWIEIIVVKPNTAAWEKALEIEESLEEYPILDEMDYSNLEWEINTDAGMVYNDDTSQWEYPE